MDGHCVLTGAGRLLFILGSLVVGQSCVCVCFLPYLALFTETLIRRELLRSRSFLRRERERDKTGRQAGRQAGKQTNRERQTDRLAGTQANREIDRLFSSCL